MPGIELIADPDGLIVKLRLTTPGPIVLRILAFEPLRRPAKSLPLGQRNIAWNEIYRSITRSQFILIETGPFTFS